MGVGGYLCLVNGTPYAWRKTESYKYQMNEATWYDYIGPFQTNTVYFEFAQPAFGHFSDDEAWADYQMEGTNYKFRLWANARNGQTKVVLKLTGMNTVSNHQHDQIDLGFRVNPTSRTTFNGVTCIIAGRDGAFVTSSPNQLIHKAWMTRSLSWIGDLTLRELCLPATHNSGMFRSTAQTFFGVPDLTLCQSRSIADQLGLGVRFFDIRPCLDKKGEWFYTGHYSYNDTVGWQGASGDWIGYIVDQINEFTRDHAEAIVLNISHAMNIQDKYRGFNQGEWERFFAAELDRLTHRYVSSSPDEDLTRLTIKQLTANGTKAAVIVRLNCNRSDDGAVDLKVGGRLGNGYFYYNNFPLYDDYANKDKPDALITDQIAKMGTRRDKGKPTDGEVFMMSWALTQTEGWDVALGLYPSLLNWARHSMTPRLGVLYDKCWGRCFPNLIGMDGVETTDGLAISVAINEWQKSKS